MKLKYSLVPMMDVHAFLSGGIGFQCEQAVLVFAVFKAVNFLLAHEEMYSCKGRQWKLESIFLDDF